MVAVRQPLVVWKVPEGERAGVLAGEFVELGVAMAICGEDVLGVEAFALCIVRFLLHTLERVLVFFFRFKNRDRKGFGAIRDFNAEEVIRLTWTGPTTPLRTGGFNGGRRFEPDIGHAIAFVP